MLNFIYYPVSFILWVWHNAFSFVFGSTGWGGGLAWAFAVVFLVFTLRAILYKPFVTQVRSMRKMQEFQPELQKVRKKYANDKQKQAAEMQRLQREHGVNPLAGCLPVALQVPVFIGLYHVLKSFNPVLQGGVPRTENYFFNQAGVDSFNQASLFGAKLGAWLVNPDPPLAVLGTSVAQQLYVMIPLMIVAGTFTHITARHSVARQIASGTGADSPQTAIMQKLQLYIFPIGVVVGAPFLPLAILVYWVSNNLWTLAQQYVVYRRIDAEQAEKREQAAAARQSLAPKPGQKPVRPAPSGDGDGPAKKPGAKPVARTTPPPSNGATSGAATTGPASNGSAKVGSTKSGAAKNNSANNSAAKSGAAKSSAVNNSGVSNSTATGSTAKGAKSGGPNRPAGAGTRGGQRPRKRR